MANPKSDVSSCADAIDESSFTDFPVSLELQIAIEAFNVLTADEQEALAWAAQDAVCPIEPTYAPLPSYFGKVAAEYRHNNPTAPTDGNDLPAFDDPHWATKIHTRAAPLKERKRLLVDLWNTLEDDDRLSFLRRVARPSELRKAAA